MDKIKYPHVIQVFVVVISFIDNAIDPPEYSGVGQKWAIESGYTIFSVRFQSSIHNLTDQILFPKGKYSAACGGVLYFVIRSLHFMLAKVKDIPSESKEWTFFVSNPYISRRLNHGILSCRLG